MRVPSLSGSRVRGGRSAAAYLLRARGAGCRLSQIVVLAVRL
jgi:hypothetical protein